jgi:hypothetical protein
MPRLIILRARTWFISVIMPLLIAHAIIVVMVTTIITAEASRSFTGTAVFREAAETSSIFIVIPIAIFG